MDRESLTFLLQGGHYNVEERVARGIWPHPPLQFDELVKHLGDVIQKGRWFPYEPKPSQLGGTVDEHGFIERVAPDYFIYHVQRALANNPNAVAESSQLVFATAEDAARSYLKWSLNLPGDLDSWVVV